MLILTHGEDRFKDEETTHVAKVYYRLEPLLLWDTDGWGRRVGKPKVELRMEAYPVIRETPKGVWINVFPGKDRFIIHGAHKRYAYPTMEEARVSFVRRKQKQLEYLARTIEEATLALSAAGAVSYLEQQPVAHVTPIL